VFARLSRTGRRGGKPTSPYHAGNLPAGSRQANWIINVPANRLNYKGWTGTRAQFEDWLKGFREIVNLSAIMVSPEMERTLEQGIARAIGKLEAEHWRKQRQLLRQFGRIVAGLRVFATV
jgi:hypothetical protein